MVVVEVNVAVVALAEEAEVVAEDEVRAESTLRCSSLYHQL